MKRVLLRASALATLLLAATEVGAALVGEFTGLSELIASSEQVVVATVLTGPAEVRASSFNDAQPQEVQIFTVLKGTIEPKTRMTVTLRTFLLVNGGEFGVLERYVLFLRRYGAGSYDLVDVTGSAFWVAPTSKVSSLPAGDIRGSIETLLREAVAYRKQEELAMEKRVSEYLASP
jgi:hypothetical protein